MDLPLRPWTPDEDSAVARALNRTFLQDPDPDVDPVELAVIEHDRTLSAWEDGAPVATAAAFSLSMAVPGTVLPVAGVTWVSVQPTHRRRGLLRRMMATQLASLHEDGGEAVAALWASEPAIYGRYGYGIASSSLTVSLQRGDPLRAETADLPGQVREVPPAQARSALAAVWQAAWPSRPGQWERNGPWWDHRLLDPESHRSGYAAMRCAVLAGDDGAPHGYALFAAKRGFDERGPSGQVQVHELVAVDGPESLQLWRFLLGLDLVTGWTARRLALDDPLLTGAADPRRLGARLSDGLYVRPVRVGEALEGRRYAADVDVVLDVTDPLLPGNARRWRLAAGPDGASCAPTSAQPDLALGVEAVGAAYLGGTTLVSLAGAGRVRELRAGALAAASRGFRGDVEPLCTHVF